MEAETPIESTDNQPMRLAVPEDLLMLIQRTLTLYSLLGYTPSLEELRYYLEHGYIPGNAPDWPRVFFNTEGITRNVWVIGPDPGESPRLVEFSSENMLLRKVDSYTDHIYYIEE